MKSKGLVNAKVHAVNHVKFQKSTSYTALVIMD